jgi:DNA-binding CsgD family transcriptional regulator
VERSTIPQVVGRRRELAVIDRAVASLADDRGGWLFVSGDPGIGKSLLLAELCARVDARGWVALSGRASEFEREVPFAPVVDALDDYLAAAGEELLEPLGEERLGQLAAIFPALEAHRNGGAVALAHERYRLHYAVRAMIERLAEIRPLVLALDDLHWADAASIELVAHLVRRRSRGPVLIALAARDRQAPETLRAAIASGSGELLSLTPLTRAEVDELLGDRDERTRAALYEESGGNPFYLQHLARVVEGQPGVPVPGVDVPVAVSAAIGQELALLSERARDVLRAAAVAGEHFEPELVADVAERAEPQVLVALDELLAAGLVSATSVPRRFEFRHPIVRRAVYEAAGPGWSIAAHERAAESLHRRGFPPAALAHHLERCGRVGDERAVVLLSEAAQAAAVQAPASAARWCEAALRLLPPDSDRGPRLMLLIQRASALATIGKLRESRDVLREVMAIPEAAALHARLTVNVAAIEHLLGDHVGAHRLLLDALDALPPGSDAEATALKIGLASDRFYNGDWPTMHRWAVEAQVGALAGGDPAVLASATALLAGADYLDARLPEARARAEEASRLVASLRDEELAPEMHALAWLGSAEQFIERFDDALAHFQRGLDISRATGQGRHLVWLLIGQASAHIWQGRLGEAAEACDAAAEISLLASNDQFLCWALGARAWVATLAGEHSAALGFADQAVEAAHGETDPLRAQSLSHCAEARLEAGEPARARDELLAAAGGRELTAFELPYRSRWYELLARAEIALGDLEAAEGWAKRAEGAAGDFGIAGRDAEALRAAGVVLLARGDHDAAAVAGIEAAELAAGVGMPIESGRGRLLAGESLAAAERRADAVAQLELALRLFGETGAAGLRDRAARELRRQGRRVPRTGARPAGDDGLAALSARELQVAECLMAGKTNKATAEELFLSEKTVESHVSHIFRKLGVSSRAEVAAALAAGRQDTSSVTISQGR